MSGTSTVVCEYATADGEARRLAFVVKPDTARTQIATIADLLPADGRGRAVWFCHPGEKVREA